MTKIWVLTIFTLFTALSAQAEVTSGAVSKSNSSSTKASNNVKASADSGTSKKKGNQQNALSQGYSASEALLMGQSRWNFVANQSFSRGFDEFRDTVFTSTRLSTSYRLTKKAALSLSTGYSTIAYKNNGRGQLFRNTDDFPDDYGLTNTTLGISVPRIWSTKTMYLNYFGSLTAPTSRTSQRATLYGSTAHGVTLRYRNPSLPKLLFFTSASLTASAHRLDRSNAAGTITNSPFGISYSGGLAIFAFPKLILSGSYSRFERFDYDNYHQTFQTIRGSVNYVATNSINIFAGYRYRDLTVTNDDLFDDDKSLAFTGVSYAF